MIRQIALATLVLSLLALSQPHVTAQPLTLVELNCENLFDCRHDSLKQDQEFTPDGGRHWTGRRYHSKLNRIGQEILSCSEELPDLVALVEVENDSVLHALTRRSLLRGAGYDYLMTTSPDVRGIDVALLYAPASFRPLCYDAIRVPPLPDMRPTRDILYVKGLLRSADTLHVLVLHAPSQYGGERHSRPFREQAFGVAASAIDSIRRADGDAMILLTGDFNTTADGKSMRKFDSCLLSNVTLEAKGVNGTPGNYRYQGQWQQLDHVLVSEPLRRKVQTVYINDAPFLLTIDERYGGHKPLRSFSGYRYQKGFSDHLPVVVKFMFP